jgi:hypothetical protein
MMKRMSRALAGVLALALVAPLATAADAIAINNATVQPAGPRSGSNGKRFFNVEGREVPGAIDFASYGVLEFDSSDLALGTVSQVAGLTVTLKQDLASFSSRGRMRFYVTEDLTTSIEPDAVNPECFFDAVDVHGLNGQFEPLYDLGTGEFGIVRTTWVVEYTFNVPSGSALETYLIGQINAGANIRIIVAPEFSEVDSELVAGTFGGYTSTTGTEPTLSVNAGR